MHWRAGDHRKRTLTQQSVVELLVTIIVVVDNVILITDNKTARRQADMREALSYGYVTTSVTSPFDSA